MRLLGKIAVILFAALLVAGATMALTTSGTLDSLSANGRSMEGGGQPALADDDFVARQRPERGEGESHHGGQSIGGGLLGIARNLSVIAAIVALVGLIAWAGGRFAARRKAGKGDKKKAPIGMDTF